MDKLLSKIWPWLFTTFKPQDVKRIKKSETSKLDVYVDIPDVEIDEVIASKILAIPSLEVIKK